MLRPYLNSTGTSPFARIRNSYPPTNIDLPKSSLPKFSLNSIQRRTTNLNLLRKRGSAAFIFSSRSLICATATTIVFIHVFLFKNPNRNFIIVILFLSQLVF
ncbi:hypothetical protein V8G54_005260 [Vigna mungo]|uniref:Transmembrane protein n=1 Tax=Vigna mungo TaxID=3915 RepID=A0AAQ3NYB7_VIGMU